MSFLKGFFAIVAAALGSSILGGLFGLLVGLVSPEFVRGLTSSSTVGALPRFAAGLGMIWGLFLGTAVMAFSLLMATLLRLKKKSDSIRE